MQKVNAIDWSTRSTVEMLNALAARAAGLAWLDLEDIGRGDLESAPADDPDLRQL